jgi:MYXO-CTERM domain-containing protein
MKIAPLVLALAGGTAAAAPVTFPVDTAYKPLRCGGTPMYDAFRDQPGFVDEGDVVGSATAPAALRASDATYLYLRIRLDTDPAPTQTPKPASWGIELDLDGDPTNYELLMLVDGLAATNAVELFTNHTVTLQNDPNDPADLPAVATYTFATNARSIAAPMPTTGGNPDFFLDFALPWSDLVAAGLDHRTATRLWVASSTSADSLNGDFACHDGAGGVVHLDTADSDATTGDPADDPNGNGSGSGTGSAGDRLEGGGGCSTTGGATTPLFAIGLAMLVRRRRRPVI